MVFIGRGCKIGNKETFFFAKLYQISLKNGLIFTLNH